MENFDLLFEKMSENYNYLQTIMGEVYERVKNDPTDESNIELLESLGNLAKRMLSTEESFVVSYSPRKETMDLMDRVETKKSALSDAMDSTIGGKVM